MASPADGRKSFADKLNLLFETVRPRDAHREYTNSEVAAATDVSASYIGYLRKGVRDNPSVETIQALARFFEVRPSYFVDEDVDDEHAEAVEARLRLVQALNDPGIKRLAMRAMEADLSPAALDAITAMIDQVRQLEESIAPKPPRKRDTGQA
ncbi:helix-turn-helix domain-containing protein [Nonomuraea endophytica]|uniref:Transcriptional regulator with XRE-family HTH domain n=1 Tax=Nonomuraea endophytica TaxID=714136 RepID=A0A7W8AF12_9ACTN|nr:helix-turn-helix domain-containing protein [Nonomuraea endophytica]MBB5083945.1 transcriptional regulator with XRE-family HTH domain [Nonomuraea endophytica]